MAPQQEPFVTSVGRAARALGEIQADDPAAALPHLRAAAEEVARAIDEAMASAVLHQEHTLRSAGELAGLSENAVGPRLAHTTLLGAYAPAAPAPGKPPRVTARAVERARYDVEQGRHVIADDDRSPMRFKPRRS